MSKETEKLIAKLVKNWELAKTKYITSKEDYGSGRTTVFGDIYWDNPTLVFVLVTGNEESYEGSQTQVGVTKDGKLKWEYQSHCSCNHYEDSNDEGKDFPPLEKKTYELEGIPIEWEEKMRDNITKILECIK